MSDLISNTTAPPQVEPLRPKTLHDDRVPAIVIVHCSQPDRLGEVAFLTGRASWTFGRFDPNDTDWNRTLVRFGRQRPTGFVESAPYDDPKKKGVSRQQLLFAQTPAGIEVTNVGSKPMRVNGKRVITVHLRHGDVIDIDGGFGLLFTSRAPAMPRRALDAAMLGAFGMPDALGIIGESLAMWSVREQLYFVASSGNHVLVHGASGTGKELAANAIHLLSRPKAPIIARNAATIPNGIAASELYGNRAGYPNPGMPEREGLVGAAEGGTFFLDEIAEMPEELQALLLRLLDRHGEYQRLGESRTRRANIRLVGATNRPLSAMKSDVLARFTTQIEMPSLNARREDIPLIARHLLRQCFEKTPALVARFVERDEQGHVSFRIDGAFMSKLIRHDYTTNVRELEAMLLRSMRDSHGDKLVEPTEKEMTEAERRAEAVKVADVDTLLANLRRDDVPVVDAKDDAEGEAVDHEDDDASDPDWPSDAELMAGLEANFLNVSRTAVAMKLSRHRLSRWWQKRKKKDRPALDAPAPRV